MKTHALYDPVKRAIDVVVAATGLLVSAPLQLVVALAVRRKLGSPVLFRQPRPGKDEKIFELVKFRTMRAVDVEAGVCHRRAADDSLRLIAAVDESG